MTQDEQTRPRGRRTVVRPPAQGPENFGPAIPPKIDPPEQAGTPESAILPIPNGPNLFEPDKP